jgi:hypothetical protein
MEYQATNATILLAEIAGSVIPLGGPAKDATVLAREAAVATRLGEAVAARGAAKEFLKRGDVNVLRSFLPLPP